MRLHAALEKCIEYVAMDCTLGSEPSSLYDHLIKSDECLDSDSFAYIWRLLASHPSIEVIVTSRPFKASDNDEIDRESNLSSAITAIGENDEAANSEGPFNATTDFQAMINKWGKRLRIRCTVDEIHYRLTGWHARNSKVTEEPLRILQFIAMSREKGISVVELNDSLGIVAASKHAKIKTLVELGLCVQLDSSLFGSATSVLVHYKFINQNPVYLALCHVFPELQETLAPEIASSMQIQDEVAKAPTAEDQKSIDQWGLPAITEQELSSEIVSKQRLLRILDHPLLKNHLLKFQGIIHSLGWSGPIFSKHSRFVRKLVQSLVEEGLAERVAVGKERVMCIRLTKYNENHLSQPHDPLSLHQAMTGLQGKQDEDPHTNLKYIASSLPYQASSGVRLVRSLECQIIEAIAESGTTGITANDLWETLSFVYRKSLDYLLKQVEEFRPPPDHLWFLRIISTQDSAGRERRLLYFTAREYRKLLEESQARLGKPVAGITKGYDQEPPVSGYFSEIPRESLFENTEQYITYLDEELLSGISGRNKRKRDLDAGPDDPAAKRDKRVEDMKYSAPNQSRGRPRVVVKVVDEAGKDITKILGRISLKECPDVPAVMVYHAQSGKLSVPPAGYDGLGAPPEPNEEQLGNGKPISYYDRYPRVVAAARSKSSKKKGGKSSKAVSKRGVKKEDGIYMEGEDEDEIDELFSESDIAGPSGTSGRDQRQSRNSESTGIPQPDNKVEGPAEGTLTPVATAVEVPMIPRRRGRPPKARATTTLASSSGHPEMALPTTPAPTASVKSGRGRPPNTSVVTPTTATPSMPKRGRGRPRKSTQATETPAPAVEAPHAIDTISMADVEVVSEVGDSNNGMVEVVDFKDLMSTGAGNGEPAAEKSALSHVASSEEIVAITTTGMPSFVNAGRSGSTHVGTPSASPDTSSVLPTSREPTSSRKRKIVLSGSPPVIKIHRGDAAELQVAADEEISAGAAKTDDQHTDGHRFRKQRTQSPSKRFEPSPISSKISKSIALGRLPVAMDPPEKSKLSTVPSVPMQHSPKVSPGPPAIDMSTTRERTPLQALDEVTSKMPVPTSKTKTTKKKGRESAGSVAGRGRLNFGELRRLNELEQCLKDYGGVITDSKFLAEHHAWTTKHANTSHPYAPPTSYCMDRKVYTRMKNALIRDDRLKQNITTTTTSQGGGYCRVEILHLPDVPVEKVFEHMNLAARELQQATRFVKPDFAAELPSTEYTDFDPGNARVDSREQEVPVDTLRPYSSKRTALLGERDVVAQLYGYKFSIFLRTQVLHRAIARQIPLVDPTMSDPSKLRVFSINLLFEELQVKDWFSIMQYTSYKEELDIWIQNPENREKKIRDVPPGLKPTRGFNTAAGREKMVKMLTILITLKAITPLIIAEEREAEFRSANGIPFETAKDVLAPYYVLHDCIPVYHLALQPPSPLLGVLKAQSEDEISRFWSELQRVVMERTRIFLANSIYPPPDYPSTAQHTKELEVSSTFYRGLRTRPRWFDRPRLTKIQREALRDSIDWSNATIILASEEEKAQFAYENALSPYLLEAELQRNQKRARLIISSRTDRLRESAIRAKDRQERLRKSIEERLSEEQATSRKAWEARVEASATRKDAPYDLSLLDFVSRMTTEGVRKADITDGLIDYWVGVWGVVKDMGEGERVERLAQGRMPMKQKGSGAAPRAKKVLQRKKAPDIEGSTTQRRNRSKRKWTVEDDDIMLDSEAIIRARSRSNAYRGRAAMNQLYPEISAQTFRSRIANITSEPGNMAYLERLEDAWYELWLEHRGTDELPDEHIEDSVNFDLKAHLDFLRKKVDKRAVRFLASSIPLEPTHRAPDLPCSVEALLQQTNWSYVEDKNQRTFDSIAESLSAEEIRAGQMAQCPVLDVPEPSPEENHGFTSSMELGKLRATLKLIIATSPDRYDARCGRRLLESWDEPTYEMAIADMADKGIFKKQAPGSTASTGGRFYDFTYQWGQLSDGPLPANFFAEAEGLEKKFSQAGEEGFEWPLIGQPGELGALMSMVSNDEAEFIYNIQEFPPVKIPHYNTRKLNDDAYEFDFRVKRSKPAAAIISTVPLPSHDMCKPVLQWDISGLQPGSIHHEETLSKVMQAIVASGPQGISRPSLSSALGFSDSMINSALSTLSGESSPRVFWAGYDTARVVARTHWPEWAIVTRPMSTKNQKETSRYTNPRRWVDIHGKFNDQEWDRAVNGVVSHLVMRPGLSQRGLGVKLNMVLDRLELVDVLEYLLEKKTVTRKWISDLEERTVLPPVEATDLEEERNIGWWPADGLMSTFVKEGESVIVE